ncbi:hypothetical protein [Streptomyces sp. NPDC001889]
MSTSTPIRYSLAVDTVTGEVIAAIPAGVEAEVSRWHRTAPGDADPGAVR